VAQSIASGCAFDDASSTTADAAIGNRGYLDLRSALSVSCAKFMIHCPAVRPRPVELMQSLLFGIVVPQPSRTDWRGQATVGDSGRAGLTIVSGMARESTPRS